jgi:CubicO group peptidase (beta-lactamase class C family)
MRIGKGIALVIIIKAAIPIGASAETSVHRVDEIVSEVVGADTPGLAVLVMREGEVLHAAGYGYADIEDETPVTPLSIFDLASVSKQMTATVSLLQMNDGFYAPETNVGEILLAFRADVERKRPIAVLDLIYHMSGLTDYLSGDLSYGPRTSNDEVVAWLSSSERDAAPGEVFDYSNSGYLVLGTLVTEAETQGSLADVLEDRIWGPLGMVDTSLAQPVDSARAVTGYSGTDGQFEEATEPNISEGDGNVFSTIVDLAYYEAWLNENGMTPMMHPVFRNGTDDDGKPIDDGEGAGYGFGWFLEEIDGSDYAYHSGSWTGTSTFYQRNLTTGVTVILLANGEDIDLDGLALEVEAVVE